MTLIVAVYRREPGSQSLVDVPLTAPGAELAGFESWRSSVYGSLAVRRRNARFLPQLERANLVIDTAELPLFVDECSRLLADCDDIARETGIRSDTLRHRLSNLVNAAERARDAGGLLTVS